MFGPDYDDYDEFEDEFGVEMNAELLSNDLDDLAFDPEDVESDGDDDAAEFFDY